MAKAVLNGVTGRLITLILFESSLIVVSVAVAAYLRLGARALDMFRSEHLLAKSLLIAGVCQACLYLGDLYHPRQIADRRELVVRVFQALGFTSLLLGLIYYWFPDMIIGRGVFLIAAVLVVALVLGWRISFEWLTGKVGPRERVLIIGTNAAAVSLSRELHDRRQLGIEIVGFIDPDPAMVGAPVLNPGVVGTIDDIPSVVRERRVDRVVVSLADARGKLPMHKLLEMKLEGVAFDHLASVYEEYTGKIALENLRPSWLIFSEGFKKSPVQLGIKRAFDIVVAAAGLVVALPVMAVIGAAVRLSSRGPVIYHQTRVGQHGRVFTIHKFRSMQSDAESDTGAVWARQNDRRVTRVGRWLRRTRLDELPQLWNVLRGHMSIVGPRPERPEFVRHLSDDIPFYEQRHVVKPGLTGWAQVCYTYGASVEDAMEKLQYDLFYIKHLSLSFDLFIILTTLKTVLREGGA